MPITLCLPPEETPLEIGQASYRASRLAQTLAMAYALHIDADKPRSRPFWLRDALRELNQLVELLQLEIATEQTPAAQTPVAEDPVDALVARVNVIALNPHGQVLR